MPPPTGPPTNPTDALAWAQEAITSNPRRCIYDTHVYKRLRERRISERSIWYAIRNATSCIVYIPDRKPLACGTCWRITGPDAEGEVTSVGVETFVDHLGRRLLVITVF
jgi:hypothetical protein